MRVLVVSPMWPSADAPQFGIFVARQVEALRRLGAEVEVAATGRGRSGLRGAGKHGVLWRRTRTAVRRHRPEVIVGHLLFPAGAIAVGAARSAGVPCVLVAHGQDVSNVERSRLVRVLTQRALDGSAATVAVSPSLEARLRAACTLRGPVHAFDMGVDVRAFHPGDRDVAAHALGAEPSRPLVVQIGNLIERKNPVRLAAAVAAVRARHGSGELWIAGDGPLATELRGQPHVRLLGAVDASLVPRVLRAADCAALVALREGYGLGAIEAIACGVPLVVSADVPVATDLPKTAAVQVDPRDVDAIAAGIEAALRLPRADPAGLAVAAEHAVDRQAGRLLEVLTAVVASGPRGRGSGAAAR